MQKTKENLPRVDTIKNIYTQRIQKCLYDAFQVFFIPEILPIYQGLELIVVIEGKH